MSTNLLDFLFIRDECVHLLREIFVYHHRVKLDVVDIAHHIALQVHVRTFIDYESCDANYVSMGVCVQNIDLYYVTGLIFYLRMRVCKPVYILCGGTKAMYGFVGVSM